MGWNCGHKGKLANHRAAPGQHIELLNLDIQGLGLRVIGSILNRQGIGGVFFWRDLHAAVVRGPNRVVLRLELHSLGVGHAITELYLLAAVDHAVTPAPAVDLLIRTGGEKRLSDLVLMALLSEVRLCVSPRHLQL